jgi:putative ABC transport system permease protein
MLKYGWHIGDTVTLRARLPGRSRPLDVRLEIAGVIPSGFFDGRVILHRDYFQELSGIRNVADVVLLTAATLASVPELCRQIEGAFLNSSMPVRAITTEQFFSQFLSGVNLRSVIALVTIVLIAATTAVTLNSLAMSIRERRREVAVLKTLGYTPFETLLLLVAEAMWMTLAGGVIGSVVAFAIFSSAGFLVRVGPLTYFEVPVRMVTYSVVLSLLIGVLAAIGPAARVSWLPIVRGLRDVR